jgi:hypothetical protein
MRAALSVCVTSIVVGCASVSQMTAADLAGRAQGNMIEAQQNLAGRDLIVRGVVRSATLMTREAIRVQRDFNGGASATITPDQVPLVILEPGTVLCYFEPGDIADAVSFKAGDAADLRCRVDSFRTDRDATLSVLSGCRRP